MTGRKSLGDRVGVHRSFHVLMVRVDQRGGTRVESVVVDLLSTRDDPRTRICNMEVDYQKRGLKRHTPRHFDRLFLAGGTNEDSPIGSTASSTSWGDTCEQCVPSSTRRGLEAVSRTKKQDYSNDVTSTSVVYVRVTYARGSQRTKRVYIITITNQWLWWASTLTVTAHAEHDSHENTSETSWVM